VKSTEGSKNERNVTYKRERSIEPALSCALQKRTTYFYEMLVILNIIRQYIMLPLSNKPLLLSYSSYTYTARIYEKANAILKNCENVDFS